MRVKHKSGYSKEVPKLYITANASIFSLSKELMPQVKWVDGRPTDEIIGYQSWFVAEGTEPFKVKFKSKVELPAMLTSVKLQNLEACEVGNNVYFRADGIEAIK